MEEYCFAHTARMFNQAEFSSLRARQIHQAERELRIEALTKALSSYSSASNPEDESTRNHTINARVVRKHSITYLLMFLISAIRGRWSEPQGYRDILRTGLPIIASMASTTVMQFTDRLFLGRYSVDAIAASVPAALASMTLLFTLQGICSYTGVIVAQYAGAKVPGRIGPTLWQGLWLWLLCSVILIFMSFQADAIFAFVGHEMHVQALEADYFQILSRGSCIALLGATLATFFFGRGQTKPVMVANILAALLKIPMDYALIYGVWGFPELGITGAGLATCFGWSISTVMLACLVFRKKYESEYRIFSGFRPEWKLFKRLVRFGLPSGFNLCVEYSATAWFSFELGALGKIPLAASNIAFSINSLTFMPMMGLNMATAVLVGQSMGKRKQLEGERAAYSALHIAMTYMICVAIFIVCFAGSLVDIFNAGGSAEMASDFPQVRALGITLLYYVALYSLVDANSIVFFGALKGAGDTFAIMRIMIACIGGLLVLPMFILKKTDHMGVHSLWLVFTVYSMILALCAYLRFRTKKWHSIRVIEKTPSKKPAS